MHADAIVVGAGIVGAAVARALTMSGATVIVVDRGSAAAATSARCEGNLLVSDKAPGPELALALRAAELWPRVAGELAAELGPRFPAIEFDAKGGLVVATTSAGAAALVPFAEAQRAAGVRADPMSAAAARALEPQLTDTITAAVHYPQDAQVQPVIATEALLASARRRGATVLTDAAVIGAIVAGGRLTGVRTSRGDLHAPTVVLAVGPWSGAVSATVGAPVPVHPRRGVILVTTRMRHQVFHKVYDADYVGAVGSDDADLQISTVVESTAAGTVLIGSSRERIGFDADLRVDVLRQLASRAVGLFPFLAAATLLRSYGGFRPYLPDHLPLIGPDPRLPGLWHATGHEGAGVGLSLPTAELLVALMSGARPAVDAAPFSVERPTLAPYLSRAA